MERPPPPPQGRRPNTVSLSPSKTRKTLEVSMVAPVHVRGPKLKTRPTFGVALSKAETILVSGSGDVLASRCKFSSKAYIAPRRVAGEATEKSTAPSPYFWWEHDAECHSVCYPCQGHICSSPDDKRSRLRGGSPPHLEANCETITTREHSLITSNAVDGPEKDEEPPRLVSTDSSAEDSPADDLDALAVLPSFDYSYFTGEGNDMVPSIPEGSISMPLSPIHEETNGQLSDETKKGVTEFSPRVVPPELLHGVPTFLPAFYQVRITQVSANPLGSHVLLISAEALLFSYGLNTNGQLGHGHASSAKNGSRGFVTTPTIVTPLLENGGKAVTCAAGVDYSYVVAMTEGRRLGRLQNRPTSLNSHMRSSSDSIHMARVTSSPSRIESENDDDSSDDATNSIFHHQLYGFGRNDGMKLGLVNPGKNGDDDVLLPRRVALHCKVWPGMGVSDDKLPPCGIFAVAASARHSAALVRRTSGAIELYTWGDASSGALGPLDDRVNSGDSGTRKNEDRYSPLPTALTAPTLVKLLSHASPDETTNGSGIIPVQVALGPQSTFVITSSGRCLSFGRSDIGLLGLGTDIVSSAKPARIVFPSAANGTETKVKSVSIGAQHAVAVTSDGRAFAWGKNEGAIMGFDSKLRKNLSHRARRTGPDRERTSSPSQDEIEWIPREVELPPVTISSSVRRKKLVRAKSESWAGHSEGAPPRADEKKEKSPVVLACAGMDLTVFVTKSGSVLSCGASSGRLGQGETSLKPAVTPKPMFGGLHLWR